jgi:hypothetical protein
VKSAIVSVGEQPWRLFNFSTLKMYVACVCFLSLQYVASCQMLAPHDLLVWCWHTVHGVRDGEAVLLICLLLLHISKQLWVSAGITKHASLLYNSSKSWCYTEMIVECSRPPVPPPQLPRQLPICGQYLCLISCQWSLNSQTDSLQEDSFMFLWLSHERQHRKQFCYSVPDLKACS